MVDLMLDLNGHLRALSKSNWRCTIKWKRGFTFEVLLDGALKYEHFSAVEGAPDSLSEGTPSFKIEIKDLLEITFELHLEMNMELHFLVQRSVQNDSLKYELKETIVALDKCT